MTDELTPEKQEMVEQARRLADEMFVGDERYVALTMWDDADYRVIVHHGFPTRRNEVHHGERILYKDSDHESCKYQIVVKPWWGDKRVIREVDL